MTIILSPEDSLRWQEGGWSAWRVEETVYEEVQRRHIREAIAVLDGAELAVLFWIDREGVRL
jgi:hypothetical protein